jgi:hypothetical protein
MLQDTWLPRIAQMNRSQPLQNLGYHGHGTATINKRHTTADRQIGCSEQIHLVIR